ncbi:hypothetical protein SAPIO_CDS1824 [Scedosporium apiospermum]|uniref:Uncharacterized protein n=1 Tax=Pseudallescheria apiosperma TaxID=563466 RepID=A0A084GDU0_PSEDA|nr:uncharacterized protein SAPIO_CDS1824 [Scedosporium apiospermum]KEZ45502.1 hypothetical protein SAPIO_CDS1824 [Scedosporium apiospermum]
MPVTSSGAVNSASQNAQGEAGPTMSTTSKPPRMRTACTECHAAKVRCSVGRTSKRRNDGSDIGAGRQRRSPSVTGALGSGRALGSPTPTSASSTTVTSTSTTIHALVPDTSEAESTRSMSPISYFVSTDKSDYNAPPIDFSDETFGWNWELPDNTNQPLPEEPGSATLLDGRAEKSHSSSSGDSTIVIEPSLPHSLFRGESDEGRERMAQLLSLCRMTYGLETHLQSRMGTLDEIMKLNKACLAEVVKLTSGKQKGQVCRCSFIMIATCLDIMLVLFEDVVRSSGLDPRGGGPRSDTRMPSLQFGVFELDPQEQLVITRRIPARELQKYRDVVRALAAEFQDPSADFFRKLMGQWCMSLTSRLGQLRVIDVEKSGESTVVVGTSYSQALFI